MYKITGSDQKVYGPVTAEQIRQWMTEGRVNATTLIQAEGSVEWKPLFSFAELAPPALPPAPPPPISVSSPPPRPYAAPCANSTAMMGFVFGILSLIPCCCFSFIFAILGVVYSAIALGRTGTHPNENKGMAVAGLIMSVLGLGGSFIYPWFYALFAGEHNFGYNWPHHW